MSYRVTITPLGGEEKDAFAHADYDIAVEFYRSKRKNRRRGETLRMYRGQALLRSVIPQTLRQRPARHAP